MKFLSTAGTLTSNYEYEYVGQAVTDLSDPKRYDYFTRKFEEAFAKYIGTKYAVAVTSGTAALHLALIALGIGKGDEVILPDLGFVSAAHAIKYVGATPVFADVDLNTWCIDADDIFKKITKHTKAILPVYMYGNKPDMADIEDLSIVNNIPIIEDACPAVGTHGAGTYGIGCFSFQGAKTLSIGEGGMVTTNSKKISDQVRKMSSCGRVTADFYYDEIGYNYRMSNIQAALGLGQLKHIKELIDHKIAIHKWYGDYSIQKFTSDSVPWMNSYASTAREELRSYLSSKRIDTRNVFPQMTSYPMYKKSDVNPNSTMISNIGLNLPSASYLMKKEIDYVKSSIDTYNRERS